MRRSKITLDSYLEAAQLFHWATKEHYILWFTGTIQRHRRTECALLKLVRNGKLKAVRYGKRLVYSVPRRVQMRKPILLQEKATTDPIIGDQAVDGLTKVYHGLGCTEGMVRFWRSRMDGEIIPERFFFGCGSVPEWGIRYENKLLLYEFCTRSNFLFGNNMRMKIESYNRNLEKIEKKFKAQAIVVFVIDMPEENVANFVRRVQPNYYFVDYQNFLKVPIGRQLYEPIYLWSDGQKYPLSKDGFQTDPKNLIT